MRSKWKLRCLMILCIAIAVFFTNLNIESKASGRIEEQFYILDDEGNPVYIETVQEDYGIRTYTLETQETEEIDFESKSNTIGVVRFKGIVVNYTEVDTGRAGYLHGNLAGDAAYIRMEDDKVVCKISGVVIKVEKSDVREIVAYEECTEKQISYYSVADNGYFIHNYTYYNGGNLAMASTRVGYKQSYLSEGKKYYSYDGHYFYEDFQKMVEDYRNNTYSNAINVNNPYYNYYQYLSLHTTAPFTAEQYNAHVAAATGDSVMLTTGSAFVATQSKYTINSLLMYGVAINESGWGTSNIAKTKNNLFGLNAVDSSPGESADTYESLEACIGDFAYGWMHKGYLNGMDYRYRGAHYGDKHSGVNVKYASDPYWGEKAAARGYYIDTNKIDYGRYTIGITQSGKVSFYKEANTTSKVLYTSEAGEGSGEKAYMYDFPVAIIDDVTGNDGTKFYKVVSDMSLKSDRSGRNVTALYDATRDYVYVKASDIKVVVEGSQAGITIPGNDTSNIKHEDVLKNLNVANTNNYLSGFALQSDISTAITKVNALDSKIKVVVKKADGTQITSGVVATGMTIEITTNGSTQKYTVVIRGDLSGDGKLTALDYVKLRNYLDGVTTLKGAYLESADTSKDGKISALDYVKLRNHLDNKSTIVQ